MTLDEAARATSLQALLGSGESTAALAAATTWVAESPLSAEAHNALGNARTATGDREGGEASFRRACDLAPKMSKAFSNLGSALRARGALPDALHAIERAIELDPQNPRAWTNLGNITQQLGRTEQSLAAYRRSMALRPSAIAQLNIGLLLGSTGALADAAEALSAALRLDPSGPHASSTRLALTDALVALGRPDEALALHEAAARAGTPAARVALARTLLLVSGPDAAAAALSGIAAGGGEQADVAALEARIAEMRGDVTAAERHATRAAEARPTANAWCEVARLRGRLDGHGAGVDEAFRRAERADPTSAAPDLWRGEQALALNDIELAELCFRRAATKAPRAIEPSADLAKIALLRGDVAMSLDRQRSLLARSPLHAVLRSNYLFTSHYLPASREDMLEAHLQWGRNHVPLAARGTFAARAGGSERRLCIGYLSADLRKHAVARMFEELLANHDRRRFAIVVYDTSERSDLVTARLRAHGDSWRHAHAASAADLARWIREDEIDVLVDLGGHTANGRLALLAMRPAPVLASFLGYPDTTGLAAVDVRITDVIADPPGLADRSATEALVRLPRCAWCFHPDPDTPPVAARPAAAPIVFGVFNNVAKITEQARQTFARILERIPRARLLIKGKSLHDPQARARFLEAFRARGIDDRVELRAWTLTHDDHLATYAEVDVSLDTFPYAGTTTTCESLWMGVPVISLAGDHHAARVGASLLDAVGLGELVANDLDGYVERAVALATDRPRLAALRASLRARMEASPLRDGASYAREIEAVYQRGYDRWNAFAETTDGAPDAWLTLADGSVISAPDRADCATRFVVEERGDGFETELRFVRRLLGIGEIAADIGASFGVYALAMARRVGPTGRVLAYEPAPLTAAHLRRSAARAPAIRVVETEAGRVLSLDELAADLPGLSFVKVAVEGEAGVLAGAGRVVEHEDPTWMWALRRGGVVNRELVDALRERAPHLHLMRWVDRLGALVPFDPNGPLDARWLSFFALSPARRAELAARGLAIRSEVTVERGAGPSEASMRWERALAAEDRGERFVHLLGALDSAQSASRDEWTVRRAFLAARVAHECGFDDEAARAIDGVLARIARGDSLRLEDGAVTPLPEQEARRAALASDVVIEAFAIEARLWLGAWSSFYALDAHTTWLDRLAELGALTPELRRMRDVTSRFRARLAARP